MPFFDAYAFKSYVDRVRAGDDVYAAYRVLERHWQVPQEEQALVRKALLLLIAADPCFAFSRVLHGFDALDLDDVHHILATLTLDDPSATAFARARIGHQFGAQRPDPLPDLLKEVERYLDMVDVTMRDSEWHAMLSDCLQINDYNSYVEHFEQLLATVEVERHAHHLIRALRSTCHQQDWDRYHGLRTRWNALPKKSHFCQCHINTIYNMDGLAALAAGELEMIPALLHKALDVRGCPHLNAGGAELSLAAALVAKGLFLDACRSHLVEARRFPAAERMQKLEAALASATAASSST